MEIRLVQEQEFLPALHLIWNVFVEDVAPFYTPEGVAEFQKFIKYDNIYPMYQSKQMIFFGAYDNNQLCGVIAVKVPGNDVAQQVYSVAAHISLFYVRKDLQGKGIGRLLYQAVYNYSAQVLKATKLTVNSAPGAVQKYVHMGMRQVAEEQSVNGLRYVPMETYVISGLVQSVDKKSKAPIVAIVIGVICILGILIFGSYQIVKLVREYTERDYYSSHDDDYNFFDDYDYDYDYDDDYDYDEPTGLDAVPEHVEDSLSYELDDDMYTYSSDSDEKTIIDFYVSYPTVTGLADDEVEQKVNDALKSVAMDTVDKIYNNPSEDIKERVLAADSPILMSYVDYTICYASEDILSVGYDDFTYEGDYDHYHSYLRTCNVNLKTGTVYEVKDIIDINDEFLDEWLKTMRSEAEDDDFLSELDKDELKKTLEGDSLDGVYVVNFFLDEDGIEIGYDLNYKDGDENNPGYVWVTAPFSYDEIQKYQKDSDFWSFK